MNELEEIMNGKHEIKHLKIDNDTLAFNTELNNYDWNLTPRDIEMIIYTLQKDKNNLQSKINKANKILDKYAKTEVEDYKEIIKFYKELRNVLKEDK